ncbi:MAG: hypothetical protein EXR78_09640 [Deltaproteobacteria bacterium]|nr:hypothetical protein [Deltaproteobacteria bacterium]
MAQITIEVSEELAQKLAPMRDRLSEVLARGLRELSPPLNEAYRYILVFLSGNPSPAAILNFKPTPRMQERISELLEKNCSGELTPAEFAELDEYERLNSFCESSRFKR